MDDFYCLNCLHSFKWENKLKSHEKLCKNKDFCWIVMPSEIDMSEFNQYMKSDKMPYIIYVDIEYLINKIDWCANNLENSSTAKIGEHILSGYSLSTIWAFDDIENKDTIYPGEDYEKVLYFFKRTCYRCNWFWKKENVTINKKELKLPQDAVECYICGKRFPKSSLMIKIVEKLETIAMIQVDI